MRNSYKGIEINCAKNTHEKIFKLIPDNKKLSIADIPCGYGAFVKRLQDSGYEKILAIDIQNILQYDFDNFYIGSMTDRLPQKKQSLDVVVNIDGIEHIDEQFKFVKDVSRVLKKGGLFLISTPNISSIRSRWRWFMSGHHNKCKAPLDEKNPNPLHHIGMISFAEIRYLLHVNGFKIKKITTNRIKPISYLYSIFIPLIFLYTFFSYKKSGKKENTKEINSEIFKQVFSPAVLFGESLIIKAEKQ